MKNPYSLNSKDAKLTPIDLIKYYKLENINNELDIIYNFKISYPNSGTTDILENGDRVWRIGFKAENAENIKIKFTKINIKENIFLHIYNQNYSLIEGPFTTELNINDDFTTNKFNSNIVIVEYYVPKKYCGCNASLKAILNISNVFVTYNIKNDIINLKKGWNLISSKNKKLNIDFNNSTIEKNILYEFIDNKYILAKEIEYGKAYWVISTINNGYINMF